MACRRPETCACGTAAYTGSELGLLSTSELRRCSAWHPLACALSVARGGTIEPSEDEPGDDRDGVVSPVQPLEKGDHEDPEGGEAERISAPHRDVICAPKGEGYDDQIREEPGYAQRDRDVRRIRLRTAFSFAATEFATGKRDGG